MKLFKNQIRLTDYAWLHNAKECRTFCVTGKQYAGSGTDEFRIVSYTILEVGNNKPITIQYEAMEDLIQTKSLEIL